ncbi:hypothetical protein [Mangrovibacterium marinum]|uniref:Uncharacterized protein n=1 Tax=Mangrovibacterium marinum TaxID=1639118 RepID=A0A2T5C2U2_9BACT|nr:hypothetical protein [Mangrovibacterium marinum]PTN09035.1 hypothetical protein C8N47_106135 [Mangrovibacterium marinum]
MTPEDKEILRLKKALPNESILKILDRYKKEYGFNDYYGALDSLLYRLGMSFGHEPIDDLNTNRQLGFIPYIIYSQENYLNEPGGRQNLQADISPFKKLEDSKAYSTKEVIYRLRQISNLEEILFKASS